MTCVLKFIVPSDLIERWKQGEFANELEKSRPIAASHTHIPEMEEKVLGETKDPVFTIYNRTKQAIVIATSNATAARKICRFCLGEYTGEGCGIPIAHEARQVCYIKDGQEYWKTVHIYFDKEEVYCHDACALADILRFNRCSYNNRDTEYLDSETLIKQRWSQKYPDATCLTPARDPSLLLRNGGSLTDEQWKNPLHIYKKLNVGSIPIRSCFERQTSVT